MNRATVVLAVLQFGMALTANCQLTDYEPYEIRRDSIKAIKEWKVSYDTTGLAIDTLLEYEFLFDDKGDMIEKRYEFNRNYTLYKSRTFKYDETHNIVDSKWSNPYSILDGAYYIQPISKCETMNSRGLPLTSTLTYKDGLIEYFAYSYDKNFLTTCMVFNNGKLATVYKIEYKRE